MFGGLRALYRFQWCFPYEFGLGGFLVLLGLLFGGFVISCFGWFVVVGLFVIWLCFLCLFTCVCCLWVGLCIGCWEVLVLLCFCWFRL